MRTEEMNGGHNEGLNRAAGARLDAAGVQKLIMLTVVCALSAFFFYPAAAFFGFNYRAGDVAVMDVKSPVGVVSGEINVKKGEIIVRDGQIITETEIRKFEAVEAAMKEGGSISSIAGFFVFTGVLIVSAYLFASSNIRKFAASPKDLLLMSLVYVMLVFFLRFSDFAAVVMKAIAPGIPASVYIYVIPVAVGPMLVRLVLNSETALVFAGVVSVIAGFLAGGLPLAAYSLVGGATAALGVKHCTHRGKALKAGLMLGGANCVALLSMSAIKGGAIYGGMTPLANPFFMILAGLLNGAITAVLAIGLAPALETAFRYTTDIKLLELSRMDHPLMKELAVNAPGTYHHSIVMGTLVEAAAEGINANPLLARVGAYYHDIGKNKDPQYFVENSGAENRHDLITPVMSADIILSHVKKGVELAREYRLGAEIGDIIEQHHGTSLVGFFYEKAKTNGGEGSGVREMDYRYPGPKPQTREAGLVMLADAIEASSRTLKNPTPEALLLHTRKMVNRAFSDGQLDECELTLKDLHVITDRFTRALAGIYHGRIEYPEPELLKDEKTDGEHPRRFRRKGA
ncbi:MAG: HDIG domain-containing protein [Deltaproteobacteria bacterium]|nr:HDIG domain-containing protein [Deltaproteobacteria bacterium]